MGNPLGALAGTAETALTLAEIGGMLLVLGVIAFLASKLKFSVVPLYLIVGLLVGQGGFGIIELSEDFLDIGAQIGAILLLLLLGLEYSARDLASAFKERKSAGFFDVAANFVPGAALALLFGWGPLAALAVGGITYVSSSGITSELLRETGWRRSELSKRIVTILVFEDLALAPYLPFLTALVLGLSAAAGLVSVSVALIITGLVLIISYRGKANWQRFLNPEVPSGLLLTVFGSALLAAGVADLAGFSGAVAAFLVGLLLTGEVANTVRGRLGSLRDLFAAIFFLFFGLATNLEDLIAALPAMALFVAIGVAGKFAVGWWIAKDLTDKMSWKRAGAFLTPRGEFSMVIAALAAPAVATVNLQALTLSYVTVTAIIGSLLLRFMRSGFDK
ncbi:MAG: cation:proton antiporter [Actinomycetota bacterium]